MQRKTVFESDPVRDNITNRIARGSKTRGDLEFDSGLLLQGTHVGSITVRNGNMIIEEGGHVSGGTIVVEQDLVVMGQLGSPSEGPNPTRVECRGTLHLGKQSVAYGVLHCASPAIYAGAKLMCQLESGN